MAMNPEILSPSVLRGLVRRVCWSWRRRVAVPWWELLLEGQRAGEEALEWWDPDGSSRDVASYVRQAVRWRMLDIARVVGRRRWSLDQLRDEDGLDLEDEGADVVELVGDRDEEEALRGWLGKQGRDGEVLAGKLDGLSDEELAQQMERSGRQIRRIAAEMARRARERFRG